jgi:hypothetical protein
VRPKNLDTRVPTLNFASRGTKPGGEWGGLNEGGVAQRARPGIPTSHRGEHNPIATENHAGRQGKALGQQKSGLNVPDSDMKLGAGIAFLGHSSV